MLPENTVTVENIGKNESDVNLSCTRETMKQLCQEVVIDRLEGMIESALEKAGIAGKDGSSIDAVEITGGGLRIPFVQETIRNAIGKGEDEEFAFSRSLDDTSLAFGASLVGIAASSNDNADDAEMMDVERQARRTELLEDETAMSRRDVELLRKDEFRNQIEAHILELRSARHSKHGSLLPSLEEFSSYLDGVDDWLFSKECDEATCGRMEEECERMEEEWNAVQHKKWVTCGEYFAATQAEADEKDCDMEREAQAAAASGGENDDEEAAANYDTRRLPTKRRMEIGHVPKGRGTALKGRVPQSNRGSHLGTAIGEALEARVAPALVGGILVVPRWRRRLALLEGVRRGYVRTYGGGVRTYGGGVECGPTQKVGDVR